MPKAAPTQPDAFVDRRIGATDTTPGRERRQFANSYDDLTPDARDLAQAIDEYKLVHRRRFITYEEMLNVVLSLGYQRSAPPPSSAG